MVDNIKVAAGVLRKGLLVIMPTDTVYGVAAIPWMQSAEDRLYELKSRDRGKPVCLLADEISTVFESGAVAGLIERRIAERFWPGAVTLVMKMKPSGEGGGEGRYEGFRVPDCETARALLKEAGGLLRVSSANVSDEPPALTAQEAVRALGEGVAYVLDDGPVKGGVPSTVIKVDDGKIVVLREGVVSESDLRKCVEDRG